MSYVSPEKLQRFWNRVKPTLDGKLTASGVVNNDTTTLSGYVLDARMGKTHGDEIDALAARVQTIEMSFPDGCSTIADAVTNNGVTTASNASPSTIATNIGKIRDSGDATNAQILTGKKAWVQKTLITGQMPDNGAVNQSLALNGTYTIPAGYHNGSGKVKQSLTAGTATATSKTGTGNQTLNLNAAGYYNKVMVDQTTCYNNAYSAGETAGYAAGDLHGYNTGAGAEAGLTVFYLPSSPSDGTVGIKSMTKTKNLPAGTYRILIMFGHFGSPSQIVTLRFGSTTRTYQVTYASRDGVETTTYPATGWGSRYGEGNPMNLYWHDSFTLSSATSVTITLSGCDAQGGNYRSNASLVTVY